MGQALTRELAPSYKLGGTQVPPHCSSGPTGWLYFVFPRTQDLIHINVLNMQDLLCSVRHPAIAMNATDLVLLCSVRHPAIAMNATDPVLLCSVRHPAIAMNATDPVQDRIGR